MACIPFWSPHVVSGVGPGAEAREGVQVLHTAFYSLQQLVKAATLRKDTETLFRANAGPV